MLGINQTCQEIANYSGLVMYGQEQDVCDHTQPIISYGYQGCDQIIKQAVSGYQAIISFFSRFFFFFTVNLFTSEEKLSKDNLR